MSGPYKSRLFNFVNRQSLRVKDRWAIALGNLRVAVEWGAQLGLYPFYWLVQAIRTAGQQLKHTAIAGQLPGRRATTQPLTIPSDRPINNLLATLAETKEFQGIAMTLEEQAVVFIDHHNQIVARPTPDQQQILQKQILWEVANYWYDRRSAQAIAPSRPRLFPAYEKCETPLLPGVRFIGQTLRWIQTGPFAKALNLFEESALAPVQAPPPQLPEWTVALERIDHSLMILETEGLATSLKRFPNLRERLKHLEQSWYQRRLSQGEFSSTSLVIASDGTSDWVRLQHIVTWACQDWFEQHHAGFQASPLSSALPAIASRLKALSLVPAPAAVTVAQQAINVGLVAPVKKNLLTLSVSPFGQNLQRLWQQGLQQLHQQIEQRRPDPQQLTQPNLDPFRLQLLLFAAFDYCFNRYGARALATERGMIDTRRKPQKAFPPGFPAWPPGAQPLRTTTEDEPWLNWDDLFGEAEVSVTPPHQGLNHSTSANVQSHHLASPLGDDPQSLLSRPNPGIDIRDDIIETEVKSAEYVKHPLERILGWLDQAMLWLEDIIATLWHWWRDR